MEGPRTTAGGTSLPPSADALETIRLQADEHPLIDTTQADSTEACVNHLMHFKAYDEAMAYVAGKDVLDVGCNTGYGTLSFVTAAHRVAGVDVSAGAIEVAKQQAGADRVEFSVYDGLTLSFPDHVFDVVTSFQVVEHVYDPAPFFREIARVLRPGGTVIFTTPNAAIRLYPDMKPWNPFHVREYRSQELEALLSGFFERVRIRGMFGTPTLYETEIARVDRKRQGARRREHAEAARVQREAAREAALQAAAAARAQREAAQRARPRWRRAVSRITRAVVPGPIRRRIRPARAAPRRPAHPSTSPATQPEAGRSPMAQPEAPPPDLEAFRTFSVADLFYADADLDRAMDFMAICLTASRRP